MTVEAIDPEKWVERYADYLFNYTIVRVNDKHLAKDLVSDTFLAALKSRHQFRGQASERTWLIAILKRKIIDYYRSSNSQKSKVEVKIPDPESQNLDQNWLERKAAISGPSAEEILENQELGLVILDCLGQLDEKQAKIFKMKTIDEIDTETICNEFGISSSNLWVIIHRARTALMDCLKKNWF